MLLPHWGIWGIRLITARVVCSKRTAHFVGAGPMGANLWQTDIFINVTAHFVFPPHRCGPRLFTFQGGRGAWVFTPSMEALLLLDVPTSRSGPPTPEHWHSTGPIPLSGSALLGAFARTERLLSVATMLPLCQWRLTPWALASAMAGDQRAVLITHHHHATW